MIDKELKQVGQNESRTRRKVNVCERDEGEEEEEVLGGWSGECAQDMLS